VASIPGHSELKGMARIAWARILSSNLQIAVTIPGLELYLECDWSQSGKGYVLYSGQPSEGCAVSINSRSHSERVYPLTWGN